MAPSRKLSVAQTGDGARQWVAALLHSAAQCGKMGPE